MREGQRKERAIQQGCDREEEAMLGKPNDFLKEDRLSSLI